MSVAFYAKAVFLRMLHRMSFTGWDFLHCASPLSYLLHFFAFFAGKIFTAFGTGSI